MGLGEGEKKEPCSGKKWGGERYPPFPERQPVVLTSAANTFWSQVRVHETGSLLKVHKMPDGDEFRKLLKRA
jgi:hypothetical protein